ncbi:hypothetical protein GCK72_008891 [Caenorhabditis remanei]|uniref:Uncharacterized protein n=1 Tax=Caenorhabditis remanei TaxID=31234 RepID=A0A6A5H2E1_CAERE|nr:hypothetical protein GCK72_008891 [Caenorhabditis remanei]KAF1760642.1 hypothetical protein GCK72_008891 [Caenorhabditis remanei]
MAFYDVQLQNYPGIDATLPSDDIYREIMDMGVKLKVYLYTLPREELHIHLHNTMQLLKKWKNSSAIEKITDVRGLIDAEINQRIIRAYDTVEEIYKQLCVPMTLEESLDYLENQLAFDPPLEFQTTEEVVNYIEQLKLQLDYNFDNTLEEQQQLMRLFHAATL